jgi:hypothetical protein
MMTPTLPIFDEEKGEAEVVLEVEEEDEEEAFMTVTDKGKLVRYRGASKA